MGFHIHANPLISASHPYRVLALVVVYLKYLWGLDDQTEYVWQHNLRLVAATAASPVFCPVTWLRLSKLRLERLATLCPHLRHQYRYRHLVASRGQSRYWPISPPF